MSAFYGLKSHRYDLPIQQRPSHSLPFDPLTKSRNRTTIFYTRVYNFLHALPLLSLAYIYCTVYASLGPENGEQLNSMLNHGRAEEKAMPGRILRI